MLRELVVDLLGTEDGADEVLQRAWARLEAMQLPLGRDSLTMLLTLAEREVRRKLHQTAPEPAPMPSTTVPGSKQSGDGRTATGPTPT